MDDNAVPGRARRTRSPEAVERLQRSRRRIRERRDAARKREQAVAGAVKLYIAAWQAITTIEQVREDDVAKLQQQISSVRERAVAEISEHRHQQALAAAIIREQGNSDDDVAELLEITPRQARQLAAAANVAMKTDGPDIHARRDGAKKTDAPNARVEHESAAEPAPVSGTTDVAQQAASSDDGEANDEG